MTGYESLNFGSQKEGRKKKQSTQLQLYDNQGTRTQEQMEKEVFDKSKRLLA